MRRRIRSGGSLSGTPRSKRTAKSVQHAMNTTREIAGARADERCVACGEPVQGERGDDADGGEKDCPGLLCSQSVSGG